jgi:hypothetical protein
MKGKAKGRRDGTDGFRKFDGLVQHRMELTLRAITSHDPAPAALALRSIPSFGD